MKIEAKIIADSVANDIRITTMELCYPRFIHSDFMTHRMFSRNASSSRAIPVEKMLEQVTNTMARPIHWGKNQPGMQAREELCPESIREAIDEWDWACENAGNSSQAFINLVLHKQVANRILEPFQYSVC